MSHDILEALLFMHTEFTSLQQIAVWLDCDVVEAEQELRDLAESLAERGSGLTLQWTAGGARLTTDPALSDQLQERLSITGPEPLSHASWEVLAIVAYRQPVTRLEVETIRQTGSDRALETLVNRELIEEVGRKETPGRPILYGTTASFLAQFGINSIEELPALSQNSQPTA